jgi:hypothetical protein
MSSKILLRRGTAAEWSSANPILGTGELGIETDTLKIKIGNGSSTWSQLSSYANVTPAQLTSQINSLISAAPATLDTLNELAAAINNDASFSTTVNNLLTGKVSKSGGDTITSSTTSTVGLIVKGAASQTADLQQWQNSAGEVQVSIKPTSSLTNVLKFTEQYSFAINWGNETILSTSSGELVVSPYGPERAALVVKGKASQTDNLQEWQNSSGNVLASVSSVGNFYVGNTFSNFGGQTINGGYITIAGSLPAIKPLLIRGAASQTANLQEWQRSDGTILSSVSSDGTATLGSMQITEGTHKAYGPFEILNNASGNSAFSIIGFGQLANASLTIGIKNTDNANNRNWQLAVGGGAYAGQSGNFLGEGGLLFIEKNPNDSSSADRAGFRRGGQFALGGINTYSASLSVTPLSTSTIGQVIRANASQTANLQEWQHSNGTVLSRVDSGGIGRFTYFRIGSSLDGLYTTSISNPAANLAGLAIRGADAQSANLQEWQNSSGAVLAKVDSAGSITATNYNLSNSLYNIKKTLKKTIDPAQNAIAGNTYDLFQIGFSSSLQGIFTMQVSIRNGGYGQSMSYTLPVTYRMDWLSQYGVTNPFFDGATSPWVDLTPITFAPRHLMTNDYLKFQARIDNNTIYFRIKLTGQLTSNPLFDVYIQHSEEFANSTVTELSSTGTDFTTSGVLPNFLSSKAGTTAIFNPLTITSSVAANVPLIIKGAASQTGDLQQWQNSTGTVMVKILSDGSQTWYNASNGATIASISPYGEIFAQGNIYARSAANYGASLNITTPTTTHIGAVIRSISGQTANLQEWQNSSGTVLAKVESTGIFNVNNIANSTLTTALVMDNSGVGTGTGTQIIFRYGGANYASISSVYSGSPTGPDMIFNVGSSGAARMRIDNKGTVTINGFGADAQGLIIKGFASQTADLQQWQNSSGTVLAEVNSYGGAEFVDLKIGTTSSLGSLGIVTGTTTQKGIVVRGIASQNADLQQWQNSAGTVIVRFDAYGSMYGFNNAVYGNAYGDVLGRATYYTSPTSIGVVVRGASGQTANLQEWQNSSGTVLSKVTSDGSIQTPGISVQYGIYSTTVGKASINPNYDTGAMGVYSEAAANKALVVRGFASQSANLQEWQNSAGTVMAHINSIGTFTNRMQIYADNTQSGSASLVARTNYGTVTPVSIQAAASQTADLTQWQDSTGAVLASIYPQGYLGLGNGYSSPSTSSRSSGTKIVLYPVGTEMDYGIGVESLFTWYTAPTNAGHKFYVNNNATPALTINSYGNVKTVLNYAAEVGLIVKGAASQTANLQEWQNSAGSAVAYMSPAGRLTLDWVTSSVLLSNYLVHPSDTGPYFYLTSTNTSLTNRTSASNTVFTVKGMASQTGDLQQWQNNSGTVLAKITASGALDVTAITVNGAAITSTPTTSDVELMNIMGAY